MNEHTCARSLTNKLRRRGIYVLKLNVNYAAGVPDMWIAGNGGSMWIELKYVPALPKRGSTMVIPHLSPLQREWLCERARQAVRVCVVLFSKEGSIIFNDPLEWVRGIPTTVARSRLLTTDQAVDWICDDLGTEFAVISHHNRPAAIQYESARPAS